MKKMLIYTSLSALLLFSSFQNPVSANTQEDPEDVKEQVIELFEETKDVGIVDSNELPVGAPMIDFDSVEDFQKYAENFQEEIQNKNEVENLTLEENLVIDDSNVISSFATRAAKSAVSTIKWGTNERWDYVYKLYMPNYMTINLSYTYTGTGSTKKFSSIKSVKSHSSGIPSAWKQTSSSANISANKRSTSVNIVGYHLVGINIKGVPLGATFNDSWKKTFKF